MPFPGVEKIASLVTAGVDGKQLIRQTKIINKLQMREDTFDVSGFQLAVGCPRGKNDSH